VSSNVPSGWSKAWTDKLILIRKPITKLLLAISGSAARHPKVYLIGSIAIAIATLGIGLFTNFYVETDGDILWTPSDSRSLSHGQWIEKDSGFPTESRYFSIYLHADGSNVLGKDGLTRAFTALNAVRDLSEYPTVCKESSSTEVVDENGDVTCPLITVTKFWNSNLTTFQRQVQNDEDAITAMSQYIYPNGAPVDLKAILGNIETDIDGTLISSQMYLMFIAFPPTDAAETFESDAIDAILDLDKKWENENGNIWRVEVFAERSFDDEFGRAIVADIPLVPAVFIVMSIFTCIVFFRYDAVFSQSLLGFGAVVGVLLSIMTGYGLLFLIGVPFTSMTQILPFIMFGIGLDDAFIISGAYARTDKSKDAVERIHDTMSEAGVSVFVTTVTSVVAFGLGCLSSIPAVYWLCMYAFPTIFIDFLFQVTFFVALIVIDERRVQDKRRDCLVCCTVKSSENDSEEEPEPQETMIDRFMVRYCDFLMQTWVKVIVLVLFLALLAGCTYSSTQLEQAFSFTDVLPSDSYIADSYYRSEDYSEISGVEPDVCFRYVDQSDPDIQDQMEDYVNQLVDTVQFTEQPPFFWLRDFKAFVSNSTHNLTDLHFNDQLDAFLADPIYFDLYDNNIVRDGDGNIVASRLHMRMDNVNQEDVVASIAALEDQRYVGASQPINEGRSDWAFFTWANQYYIWDFYAVAQYEMTLTAVLGIISVTIIGTIFIPHWTAVSFVLPLISMLYVDLLGVLQISGVAINAVSYVSIVMSVGLMVDFLLHILLRYYESKERTREAKVKDTLRTMGSSILIGGISTFLGVIPLAFSSSEIFNTIFITFMGLVTLGVSHGLILIPVVLSLVGTTDCINIEDDDESGEMGESI